MFRVTNNPHNRTTTRRLLGRLAAPIAILGLTAPMLAADPQGFRGGDRDDRGHEQDRGRDWDRDNGRDNDRDRDRDRDHNWEHDRDHGDVRVVIGGGFGGGYGGGIWIGSRRPAPVFVRPVPVVVRPVPVVREVMPMDLQLVAYQTRNTVLVIATGRNRTGGFQTTLTGCDVNDSTPELVLRNTIADGCVTQCVTAFEERVSFENCNRLRCLKVKVAGQCIDVPVVQVQRL